MNTTAFDPLTRRASLMVIGMTGLPGLAGFAGLRAAIAKNRKKNSTKKKARQKCKNQVGQCISSIYLVCGPIGPDCLALAEQCCLILGSCDVTGYFACLTPEM